MREFAEQEIWNPDGPYANLRFRCDRQPYSRLFFDAVDSGNWRRFVSTGPTQTGKTLTCVVIPTVYHLFEIGENVIFGVPDMDIAGDKWREDLEPVIRKTRFADLMPKSGGGSRGGKVESIKFRNGATLKFMSGGGGDKSRAAFTSRVVVITETDGMDTAGGGSREADKISQIEARTMAYDDRARIYMECTVSIEKGRTWVEYKAGTESRIWIPCPKCDAHVSPERDHFMDWQHCTSEQEAKRSGKFFCPACGEAWTPQDRVTANRKAILAHRGQTVEPDGTITGDMPDTETLGFRWSAVNNMFISEGTLAVEEWKSQNAEDEENAEKKMRQFFWCLPYKPPIMEEVQIDARGIPKRMAPGLPKGRVPDEAIYVTIGVDLGKWLAHWCAVAWLEDARGHIFDYGRFQIPSDQLGVETAIVVALREFRDIAESGWVFGSENRTPDQVWIDSRYKKESVFSFVREDETDADVWRPCQGFGVSQSDSMRYSHPSRKAGQVVYIGEEYHVRRLDDDGVYRVNINADAWKTWGHERLVTKKGTPGAMTVFQAMPREHLAFAKQLTAEKQMKEFVPGKGEQTRWIKESRNNHWLDTYYIACTAGHFEGVRLVKSDDDETEEFDEPQAVLTTPDGRPYLVSER